MKPHPAVKALPFLLILVAVALVLGWILSTRFKPVPLREKAAFAAAFPGLAGVPVSIAMDKGFFRSEGLDVSLDATYAGGSAILDAVADGRVDFGVTSETSFMQAVLAGKDIATIATVLRADRNLALVARKDRGIGSGKDLRGKTIGVTPGSNGEYFLDLVLLGQGISRDDVRAVALRPDEMLAAILDGKTDAIATWDPEAFFARKRLGENAVVFYEEDLYTATFLVSARKDFLRDRPETAKRVVRALLRVSDLASREPTALRAYVAKYFKIEEALLDGLTAQYDFRVSLDQSVLLVLENQARWAMKRNMASAKTLPDFLDRLDTRSLDAVRPEAVTIIR